MKKKWFLIILIFLNVFLLVFGQTIGQGLRNFLTIGKSSEETDVNNLISENKSLKTELAVLRSTGSLLPKFSSDYLAAAVYSSYPFNFKNEILVNAGMDEGIKAGAPAVIPSPTNSTAVLIGKVEKVFPRSSLIETIFDGRLQLAVRIGDNGTDALLRGGANPTLALIPKDSDIAEGDSVYSAAQDFPYGSVLGAVKNIRLSGDQLFKEADLADVYNPNSLRAVFIEKNYAP